MAAGLAWDSAVAMPPITARPAPDGLRKSRPSASRKRRWPPPMSITVRQNDSQSAGQGIVLEAASALPGLLAAVVAEGDVVGRVGERHSCTAIVEQADDSVRFDGIAAQQAVCAQEPKFTGLDPWLLFFRLIEGCVHVERLGLVALGARDQCLQEGCDLRVAEACKAEVQFRLLLEPGNQLGEELVVPLAVDLIECEVQQACCRIVEIDPNDGHGLEFQPARRQPALMAIEDSTILLAGNDRRREAELLNGPAQGIQTRVVDAPRIRRVRLELVERHLNHLPGDAASHAPRRFAACRAGR